MMFKACQYATNDDKFFMGLILMNEKDLNQFAKKNYMGKKIKEAIARMRKGLHCKWEITQVENFCQNKVCQQNYNVRKDIKILTNYFIMSWEVE